MKLEAIFETALRNSADMSCQENKEGQIFTQIMFDVKNHQDCRLVVVVACYFFAKYIKLVLLETEKADKLPGYMQCYTLLQCIKKN